MLRSKPARADKRHDAVLLLREQGFKGLGLLNYESCFIPQPETLDPQV